MDKIRILIIEDELIIAQDLSEILVENGHEVCAIAKSYDEGISAIDKHTPDIILLDIQIRGTKDGIVLAQTIRDEYKVPFIFISSHTDKATLERVKDTNPYGFLVKPYEEEDVLVAVEMALNNFSKEQNAEATDTSDFVINQSLFVRHKNLAVKVKYEDILYAVADANYCTLHTKVQKYILRSTLKELESKLKGGPFYRSHKSYLINLNQVTAINSEIVCIGEDRLPIGREQQTWLMQHVNKL